jgi:hypothetical protein
VRGKNHEQTIDTGKFFQKNEKSNNKQCNRFRRLCPDYSWEIHAIKDELLGRGINSMRQPSRKDLNKKSQIGNA